MNSEQIDWSSFGEVHQTCECKCGHFYRSHAKGVKVSEDRFVIVSQKACSDCGAFAPRAVRSDPERMTL